MFPPKKSSNGYGYSGYIPCGYASHNRGWTWMSQRFFGTGGHLVQWWKVGVLWIKHCREWVMFPYFFWASEFPWSKIANWIVGWPWATYLVSTMAQVHLGSNMCPSSYSTQLCVPVCHATPDILTSLRNIRRRTGLKSVFIYIYIYCNDIYIRGQKFEWDDHRKILGFGTHDQWVNRRVNGCR